MIHHLKSEVQPALACLACGVRYLLAQLFTADSDIEVGRLQRGDGRLEM
jgi:hypothetical protein